MNMKTVKTSELSGVALDWAVAKCEGLKTADLLADGIVWLVDSQGYISRNFNPSSNWTWGGPIIEREKLTIEFVPECYWHFPTPTDTWTAKYGGVGEWIGLTPLIAAMRCYVASKLGDTVKLPEELLK